MGRFLLSAVITAVLTAVVLLRFPVKKKGQALKEKAIAHGFVAVAHLISSRDTSVIDEGRNDFRHTEISFRAVYEYEVNGRVYRVKAVLNRLPPASITVYYPGGDPHKVFLDGYEPNGALPALLGLLPLVFMAAIYHLLGRAW